MFFAQIIHASDCFECQRFKSCKNQRSGHFPRGAECLIKPLVAPSAGTWVTFGGQISDEVSRFIQRLSFFSSMPSVNATGEQPWQLYSPISSPHGINWLSANL